jgi:recombination protein RecA
MANEKKKAAQVKSLDDFDAMFASAVVNIRERAEYYAKEGAFLPTGSVSLDRTLGGGMPKGKMIEVWGGPHGGKSTLALSTGAELLARNKKEPGLKRPFRVGYADVEKGLDLLNVTPDDPEILRKLFNPTEQEAKQAVKKRTSWFEKNRIDPYDPNFRVYEPMSGEQLFEMMFLIAKNNLFDLFIVDSVPAIVPQAILDGDAGDSHYGALAKLLAQELPKLVALFQGNLSTSIIFINQMREKVGGMVKGQQSAAGHALKFYVSTRMRVTRIAGDEVGDELFTQSIVKVEKNRFGSGKQPTIWISSKHGLDAVRELFEFGNDAGYIHTHGAWYTILDRPTDPADVNRALKEKSLDELPGFLTRINGKAGAFEFLHANGWREKLYAEAVDAEM